ncbi:MAG: beta-lactamase family protein [Parvularculaceae bacterium]|nr:beta-lactamase family protein [Parvularculaceae bacterium]
MSFVSALVGLLVLHQAAHSGPGGFIVGFVTEDGLVEHRAEGPADLESGRAVDMDTVFHIASLSKQITAAGLAMAILDGHVRLDDPVSKHIPEAAHYGDDLTVAHLVYFTSGLTEPYGLARPGDFPWAPHFYYGLDELIDTSLAKPELRFEPGSEWQYNNINYMLIARIVSRAYDQPFSDVIDAKIFAPLGMSSSLINDDITQVVPLRANGIVPRNPNNVAAFRAAGVDIKDDGGPILIRRTVAHYGGSGVMTSLTDWAKWQQEALTRDVFGDAFWELMTRRQRFDHDKDNDAFGLVHGNVQGTPVLWFSGGDIDASSQSYIAPDAGVATVCFSNQPGFDCSGQALDMFKRAVPN